MTPPPRAFTTLGLAHCRYGDFAFGLRPKDRLLHSYIVGQTGTGKSTLLGNMILQDAAQGTGVCLIDPHGDLAEHLAGQLGAGATYWPVADPASPFGYNPLTFVSAPLRPLIASGLIETLKMQWVDAWGVRMEHLLRHAVLALLDTPGSDLRDVLSMFLDREFRVGILARVRDPQVRQFWEQEYPKMNYKNAADGLAPIANKLGAFLAHPVIRTALCEPQTPLRFRKIMDDGQVLIVNLAKGRLGADTANIVGGLLVSALTHAAFSRHDLPEADRRPCMLYVDEFHSFTTETVADLLSETRKYRLGVTLSQQHIGQSSPAVLASVLGNAGTLICFRVGAVDAPLLSAQLGGVDPATLVTLPNYRAFLRMMVDGQPTRAFSMTTLPEHPVLRFA